MDSEGFLATAAVCLRFLITAKYIDVKLTYSFTAKRPLLTNPLHTLISIQDVKKGTLLRYGIKFPH